LTAVNNGYRIISKGEEIIHFVFRWFEEAGKYQETMSGMLYSESEISGYEWMEIPK